jgi:lysozyme
MDIDRKPIFGAAKKLGIVFSRKSQVDILDAGINAALGLAPPAAAPAPSQVAVTTASGEHRHISANGQRLIHSFEQCRLQAYPDPGSRNGEPWTIGWGSTGADIKRGTVWTQQQCDERFAQDIGKYERAVLSAIGGAPTTQNQFDAMVCLCYNIGTGAFGKSTVARKHKAGDYLGAARAFLMWNKNDGQVMRGLTRRRMAEADLYDDPE